MIFLPKFKSKCKISFKKQKVSTILINFLNHSGKLEGERKRPSYKHILENPVLAYSGAYQHLDLYVTTQVFANNQELCMPVKTSYKHIDKEPWLWDEWLTLPLRFKDLPRNALLVITVWDIESAQSGDVPVCGCTISLFDKHGY